MTVLLKNNARSVLANSLSSEDSSLLVRAGNGAKFPEITNSATQWFPITLEDVSGNIEIMRVTARNGDVFTVLRGQEGTAARAWSANDVVELRVTSALLQELAADTATNFSRIYRTPAEGLDPIKGVASGYYFNVRSTTSEHYVDEYQNVNGVAVATGKAYPSKFAVDNVQNNVDTLETLTNNALKLVTSVQSGVLTGEIAWSDVPNLNDGNGTAGGTNGVFNAQAQALLNRIVWLAANTYGKTETYTKTEANNLFIENSEKGQPNGVPNLDVNGLILKSQLPINSGGQFIGNADIKAVAFNAKVISEDITIPGTVNALSAGPIEIGTGFTVTIETGATWVIV